jgi:hypothetical protein
MVDGKVSPPRIVLENGAIVRRHVHSVALAMFERESGGHTSVADFSAAASDAAPAADDFERWLRSKPELLRHTLRRIVPSDIQDVLGIDDWAWVSALLESRPDEPTFGWFTRAKEEVAADLALVDELIASALERKNYSLAQRHENLRRTLSGRYLLGFLASRNVLPKYGFPIDVVELNLAHTGDASASDLDLSRDLSLAIAEYAPGGEVVAGKALWESVGLVVRRDRAWPKYAWAVCADCKSFRHRLEELTPECGVCGSTEVAERGIFIMPIFGFIGRRSKHSLGDSRPMRSSSLEIHFGSYKDAAPDWAVVPELSGRAVVRVRVSRQGRITIINTGSHGRGFRVCDQCGHAAPAPTSKPGQKAGSKAGEHEDPRVPGRKCKGTLFYRHLGHEFLTDTVEIEVGIRMQEDEARSALYALLEAARQLDIDPNDIDGTLHYATAAGGAPSLVILDRVPGGAGYARRIGENLPRLFEEAYRRVAECECGEETSCYNCLRNYRNQIWHDRISRRGAMRVLAQVSNAAIASDGRRFPPGVAAELALLHDDARPLVEAVIRLGAPMPVVGYEVRGDGADLPWLLEAAWEGKRVAIVFDRDPARDERLMADGWDVRAPGQWTSETLFFKVV